MSDWKQINLTSAVGKVVFDDTFGFMRVDGVTYRINDREIGSYFIDGAKGHKKKLVANIKNADNLIALFSMTVYYENRNYGKNKNEKKYIEVKVEKITANVSFMPLSDGRYTSQENRQYEVKEKNKEELKYLSRVWTCSLVNGRYDLDDLLTRPFFKDLKEGGEIIYNGRKCVIKKVYAQPNEKGLMISVKYGNEIEDLSFSDKIYVLPYEKQCATQTEIFNDSKKENELNPLVEKSECGIIVYWNKIDDAAEYVVSFYKIIERPYLQNVYHLADFAVERNESSVTVEGLDESDVITVRAENRQGKIVALSRGILLNNSGYLFAPRSWKGGSADFRNLGVYFEINGNRSDSKTTLLCPQISDLKKGLEVIYNGRNYKIQKVYTQPNEKGLVMSVSSNDYYYRNSAFDLTINDKVYVAAKDLKSSSQMEIFDICKNEFDLSPFAEKSGQRIYVYWNKPDSAVEYTVSLYKVFERPYFQNIYRVKDYTVDRHNGYISIDGLEGKSYIVTVRAENRTGEEIALSRGILIDDNRIRRFPQYWKGLK